LAKFLQFKILFFKKRKKAAYVCSLFFEVKLDNFHTRESFIQKLLLVDDLQWGTIHPRAPPG
jgi:hypothetical protein